MPSKAILLFLSMLLFIPVSINAEVNTPEALSASRQTMNQTTNQSVKNTHEYTLPNGLKLIVREDHRSPVVFSSLWYKVGGSYEHDSDYGLSHALEHMMFNGTTQFGPGQFEKIISQQGGVQNAMTTSDYTVYYEQLAADKLPIAFMLEADRMKNLKLDKKVFDREKRVIMEERRMRIDDDPKQTALERLNTAAFINNPYHNPVIGWMSDIIKLNVNDLRHWYDTWYAPNNAVLLVVGDVKPDNVYQLASKYFGSIKTSSLPTLKRRAEVPELGSRIVNVNVPAQLPWLVMGYYAPVLTSPVPAWKPYALMVAANILGGVQSSRIAKNLVRDRQIATDAEVDYNPFQLYDNLFLLSGTPASGHTVEELQNAFSEEIKKLQNEPVSEEELARIKTQILAQDVFQRDSGMNLALSLGQAEMIGKSWKDADELAAQIQKVTREQIQAVAREYLIPENLTVTILHPIGGNQVMPPERNQPAQNKR